MIDEKKLIEDIKEWSNEKEIKWTSESVISLLESAPKIGGWIPCSERLPEESLNSVLGWDEYRERECFVQYYGRRWNLGDNRESVKIIAWQPLPEPYKG